MLAGIPPSSRLRLLPRPRLRTRLRMRTRQKTDRAPRSRCRPTRLARRRPGPLVHLALRPAPCPRCLQSSPLLPLQPPPQARRLRTTRAIASRRLRRRPGPLQQRPRRRRRPKLGPAPMRGRCPRTRVRLTQGRVRRTRARPMRRRRAIHGRIGRPGWIRSALLRLPLRLAARGRSVRLRGPRLRRAFPVLPRRRVTVTHRAVGSPRALPRPPRPSVGWPPACRTR